VLWKNWRRRRRVWDGSASEDATEGALEGEPEDRRGGNTMGMSGRLSMVGTGYRDARPVLGAEVGGEEGSCTEGRGVVISMTGGVEGAEHGKK